MSKIEILTGDITDLDTAAIVNAANNSLLGGGGVDGAIHRAAGPGLLAECRALQGCETGRAKLTGGHQLRAEYVIHTVGPVWQDGAQGEADLLASCYREVLKCAHEAGIRSLAFPAISCGIYGFPIERAVAIAVREVQSGLQLYPEIERVVFCCFDDNMADEYRRVLGDDGATDD